MREPFPSRNCTLFTTPGAGGRYPRRNCGPASALDPDAHGVIQMYVGYVGEGGSYSPGIPQHAVIRYMYSLSSALAWM